MTAFFTAYLQVFDNQMLYLALVFWVADLITGNAKAWITKDVDSNVGIVGTIKHLSLLLLIVLVMPAIDVVAGSTLPSSTMFAYATYQYGISLLENYKEMGFNLPESITKYFRRLK